MSGTAERVRDPKRVQELSLLLFEKLPQAKRLVPDDPKQLAIFAIRPVAISLVDYACGYGKCFLIEL